MPCTICKETTCRADTCQSFIIEQQFTSFCGTFSQQVERSLAVRQWPPYRISDTVQHGPASQLYFGSPDVVRQKIVDARIHYLSTKVCVEIKKTIRRVTQDWSIGLFKRVFPRFLEYVRTSYSLTDVDEFDRLLVEPRLRHPNTCTDYRGYASSLANWLMRQSLPNNFLDLSDVHYRDLQPPTQNTRSGSSRTRIEYRHRIICKEIRVYSKITMKMCGPDEEYMIDDTCPICMEKIQANNVIAYTCGHAFCCDCSTECLQKCGRKCPMCREKTTQIQFKPDILPEKFNILANLIR